MIETDNLKCSIRRRFVGYHFGYPVLRYGKICKLDKGLNSSEAKKVCEDNKQLLRKEDFISNLTKYLLEINYSFKNSPSYCDDSASEKMCEISTTQCSKIMMSLKHGENKKESFSDIECSISVTACPKPNWSKIWVSLFFKGQNGINARCIDREKLDNFYSYFEDFIKAIGTFIQEYVLSVSLKRLSNIEIIDSKDVFIRMVSSHDKSLRMFTYDLINQSHPNIGVDERIKEDLSFFVNKIFINESKQMKMYGLSRGSTRALYTRTKFKLNNFHSNPVDIDYFGIAFPEKEKIENTKNDDREYEEAASSASKALVESISHFV